MTMTVTLLMSSGDPDPTWPLSPKDEQEFLARLSASIMPNTVVNPPSRRAGYAGIMVRDGAGERWVVYRGWIRGGTMARSDHGRVLEQWLLDTGQGTVTPKLMAELSKQIAPPA
jgi:hypothetical protein